MSLVVVTQLFLLFSLLFSANELDQREARTTQLEENMEVLKKEVIKITGKNNWRFNHFKPVLQLATDRLGTIYQESIIPLNNISLSCNDTQLP